MLTYRLQREVVPGMDIPWRTRLPFQTPLFRYLLRQTPCVMGTDSVRPT